MQAMATLKRKLETVESELLEAQAEADALRSQLAAVRQGSGRRASVATVRTGQATPARIPPAGTESVYVVRPLSATRYELCNLAVAPPYRRKGLGRWLLGHAIGLSETKGGREILVRNARPRGLFERAGFELHGDDLLLTLTPE